MIRFFDAHRDRFGVEPICRALQFAPSTYWSAKRRPPSARSMRDEELKVEIPRVFEENHYKQKESDQTVETHTIETA